MRRRRRDEPASTPEDHPAQAPGPPPYVGVGRSGVPEPTQYVQQEIAQSVRLVTTPMPYDVEASHEPVIVTASAAESSVDQINTLLAWVIEELGRQASQRGCDAVYGIQHTVAVSAGTIYITAIGTGSRPTVDMDGPPQTGR